MVMAPFTRTGKLPGALRSFQRGLGRTFLFTVDSALVETNDLGRRGIGSARSDTESHDALRLRMSGVFLTGAAADVRFDSNPCGCHPKQAKGNEPLRVEPEAQDGEGQLEPSADRIGC
jgi:hypothetical protein